MTGVARPIDLPTDVAAETRPPLRVGATIKRSFAGLLADFTAFAGAGIALLAVRVVSFFFLAKGVNAAGFDYMLQQSLKTQTLPSAASVGVSAVALVLSIAASSFIHLVLLDLALKRQTGVPGRVGDALRTGVRFLLSMMGAYVSVWFLVTLGVCALIVPGIWLIGVYAVVSAVILAEGRHRGFMRRTRQLTKGYRWPLVGFVLIIYLVALALGLLALGAGKLAVAVIGTGTTTIVVALVLNSVVEGLAAAFTAIAVAQVYRRLREVKEGGGDLAAVFA